MVELGSDLFEKETTVSQTASHIVRLMVLQQLDLVYRSYRVFIVSSGRGGSDMVSDKRVLFAHLSALLSLCRPAWLRKDDSKKSQNALLDSESPIISFDQALQKVKGEDSSVVDDIGFFLDSLELTRFDTKIQYDRTNIYKSNKHHGY